MKLIDDNYIWILLVALVFTSCDDAKIKEKNSGEIYISEIREQYAPDSRVALFDVEVVKNGDSYVLKGETNMPEAKSSFLAKLDNEGITYHDSIRILPSKDLEGKTLGVVKISVANLRDEPKHSAQLVTQATLGMPLKVYKYDGGWYYIQTPDGYLAWVDAGGIQNMNEEEFGVWKSSKKLIYLEPFGNSFEKANVDSQSVADLVAGDILELLSEDDGFFRVKYPDGREAFVEKTEAKPYDTWLSSLEMKQEDLVATSKKLMGLPYLWGGTSPKGVDCSGFTKTVYFLNGMVIPRDASQQIQTGQLIDSNRNFENLVQGDLLFFGRPATDSTLERVIHVGMWIGNNQFIHSSGDVHISTMDTTASDFDEYNYNRYLRSKRVFNETDDKLLYLKDRDIFVSDSISEEFKK